ncbi:MAG: hypothetical protein ACO3TG_03730 [Minisyncoccia bacterium]
MLEISDLSDLTAGFAELTPTKLINVLILLPMLSMKQEAVIS